ncbi:unnamed protein product [Rhizoctonia solani]|uniref:Uncharacterized protein n=1 Tax=Rhizoctonia solani TaxID=456999 RepID=A0A8H3ABC5_9AGAM|nr:unnamed protein product [Rhizoctonia solani]
MRIIIIMSLAIVSLVSALAPINEVERNYRTYEEAARQACLYILTGKIDSGPIDKQIPPAFTLNHYPSKAVQPPWINGKTVGLGVKETPTSDPVDFIRIDYDPIKKFHFKVQALTADRTAIDYTKVKLAAKFPSNARDSDKYFQTLVEPLNRKQSNNSNEYAYSPVNIWELWRSGKRPSLATNGS